MKKLFVGGFVKKQKEDWTQLATEWDKYGPSMRPSMDDLQSFDAIVTKHISDMSSPKIVILGSTPELRDLCAKYSKQYTAKIICVDQLPDMYFAMKDLMLNKNPFEEFIQKNWVEMNLPKQSVDVIMSDWTDGNVLPDLKSRYYDQISKALKTNGIYVTRMATYRSSGIVKPILDINQILGFLYKLEKDITSKKISLFTAGNYFGSTLASYSYYKNNRKVVALSFYKNELDEVRKIISNDKMGQGIFRKLDESWGSVKDKQWYCDSLRGYKKMLEKFFKNIRFFYSHDYPDANVNPVVVMERK